MTVKRKAGALGLAGFLAAATTLSIAPAVPASAAPADEIRSSQQWILDMMDVPAAWEKSEGAGVTVAVVDSGVNPSVSDLAGSVTAGPDLTGLSTSPDDSSWGVHGTWMASIIAGHGHAGGGSGVTGIAPKARLLSIRVIPDKGDPGYNTYDSEQEQRVQDSLASGIRDAVRDGAQVISMSIGYSAPSGAVRAALQYAESHGVVLVASSGNSGQDLQLRSHGFAPVSFPAEYPGVLSVAAVAADGAVAGFSSNNLSVQVAAPGVNVPAEGRDGQYWLVSGTSPACALVAGTAALIKSRYPGLAPALVDQALTTTARNGSANGYDAMSGFGTVDAAAALRKAGTLAAQAPGKSPEASSANYGGGPAAVPASPVPPRGPGQVILFSVLALVALALAIGGVAMLTRLARLRRRPASPGATPYGYAVTPPAGPPPGGPLAATPAGAPGWRGEPQYPVPQYPVPPQHATGQEHQGAQQYPASPQYPAPRYPAPEHPAASRYPTGQQYPAEPRYTGAPPERSDPAQTRPQPWVTEGHREAQEHPSPWPAEPRPDDEYQRYR